jgi:predicted nucleotide-binding protein
LSDPSQIEVKTFSADEIERGQKKLHKRIEEVKVLEQNSAQFNDAQTKTVTHNIRDTIRDLFGPNSPEFNAHKNHVIFHGTKNILADEYERQDTFVRGIPQTVIMLEGLIDRLEEKKEDIEDSEVVANANLSEEIPPRDIFVVHGHDKELLETVARFLTKLELNPIILHEQPSKGKTIIEKVETYSNVKFAVVLLTPDDVGAENQQEPDLKPRARQNIILELGYFIGKLGREHACPLYKGDVELPSDFEGVIYVPIDKSDGWKLTLAKEIRASGIDVDLNLL